MIQVLGEHNIRVTQSPMTYTLSLMGLSPHPALTLLGGARFIAWHLRCLFFWEYWQSPMHFLKCQACLSYGPPPGPTLKKTLCHTCLVGGTYDKYSCRVDVLPYILSTLQLNHNQYCRPQPTQQYKKEMCKTIKIYINKWLKYVYKNYFKSIKKETNKIGIRRKNLKSI